MNIAKNSYNTEAYNVRSNILSSFSLEGTRLGLAVWGLFFLIDLTEPRNCVFKAAKEFSILPFISFSLESQSVPQREVLSIEPVARPS